MTNLLFLLAEAAGEAAEHGGEHAEATLLGLGAEGWVYTGVSIFLLIAVFGAKAHRKVLGTLDAQIAETRKSLDEAKAVRAEAEALLAGAKAQQAAAAEEAKGIVAHAAHEAEAIIAKAEADAAELVVRREKMAQDKISAAERSAVEGLRAKAAQAAAGAARDLIAASHSAKSDKGLVDEAIAGL
jgi:F-type H+-transporting ATPase subunit b